MERKLEAVLEMNMLQFCISFKEINMSMAELMDLQ